MELMNLTASQVINYLADNIAEGRGISKTKAKQLLLNALTYNVVIEEIEKQIDYLNGDEIEY